MSLQDHSFFLGMEMKNGPNKEAKGIYRTWYFARWCVATIKDRGYTVLICSIVGFTLTISSVQV